MKYRYLALIMCFFPLISGAATRDDGARVGVKRMATMAASRVSNSSVNVGGGATQPTMSTTTPSTSGTASGTTSSADATTGGGTGDTNTDCRTAYRACMDDFCLLDESQGERCACSDNINKSKALIKEIRKIQEEADRLYTEGVERERLGAKANYIFDKWLGDTSSTATDDGGLGEDVEIGSSLYEMAAGFCADELASCESKAEMEETLYTRMIVQDCKNFESYLADQKTNVNANKRTAEAAVRAARLEEFGNTNKYNRGECLLAYRACIADKGGCGTNFENCLDRDLLGRRANACDNVLDQCLASRSDVLKDWADEAEMILADAAKYADKYARQTCLSRIQLCLEDGCSTSTNSACLTDVNVAAGICPVIDECNEKIPGIKTVVNSKLGYLRLQFCQNDVDKCLRDKCGENFTAPECLGKNTSEIVAMCPQKMFPSCTGESVANFRIIVNSALLQMDYQQLQGCINYFSEQLGKVCGTDMACLPSDDTVAALDTLPDGESAMLALRDTVRNNAATAVDNFFKQFEKDQTVAACASAQQPTTSNGKKLTRTSTGLGSSVFNTAKMIANIGAENRALRALESKIAELSRKQDIEKARETCMSTFKVESKPTDEDAKNYSYIRSVSFEPSTRNCHVCRMQQVCESGGESKGAAALKSMAGMSAAGASAGTMVTPGWGTAIGGAVGAIGGAIAGATAGGMKDYCQELESCEDVNM